MNNNIPYYSAISRESIVRRIKRLAGEAFSFEDFAIKDKASASAKGSVVPRPAPDAVAKGSVAPRPTRAEEGAGQGEVGRGRTLPLAAAHGVAGKHRGLNIRKGRPVIKSTLKRRR